MKKVLLPVAALGLLPSLASAQGATQVDVSGLTGTIQGLTTVVNYAIPFLLAVAVVVFIIGIIRYLFSPGGEQKQKAKDHLIWGVVSITVILAVFGIARLLINLFGLNPAQLSGTEVPSIPIAQPIEGGGFNFGS